MGQSCSDLVDPVRYPIHDLNDPTTVRVVQDARDGLANDGCARLPDFILPEGRKILAKETEDLSSQALHSQEEYTPYGTGADESFPPGHPRRTTHRTTSGSVTQDLIPEETTIQRLYRNEAFMAFIAACLESDVIYPFADPMRSLILNCMDEGAYLGWHFDANEFVVSLMTQRADAGGMFEFCPNIRKPGHESYDAVQSVLEGELTSVRELDLQVGDLQIFKGRYALHRVAPIFKGTRHTAIFGFSRQPGFIGSVASTMKVYGRVMQEHVDADKERHYDGLAD